MDSRLFTGVIISLVVGVGVGYLTFNSDKELGTVYSDLEATLNELDQVSSDLFIVQSEKEGLQEQVEDARVLRDKYIALRGIEEEYNILKENNVPKANYDILSNLSDILTEENNQLANNLSILQEEYETLENQYNELYADYQIVNSPQSKFTTLDDLEITLTTDKTVYNYTEPIFGNVSIYYKTGEPFEGSFEIHMAWEGASGGKGLYNINGDRGYSIFPPKSFSAGPGDYTIRVAWLKDKVGYYIHTGGIDSTAITLEAK